MQRTQLKDNTSANIDIRILNILRCEPPSLTFNFFEYGGLTRSVFRSLQRIGNLEEIISDKSGKTIYIPSSSENESREHMLYYQRGKGIDTILANTYNSFSNQSDAKFFGRTEINGSDGKKYDASFLALEVYREKGDLHPIWELGFYITKKGGKDILYGEEIIVDMPKSSERTKLQAPISKFISSMSKLKYDSSLKGFFHSKKSKYLKKIINDTKDSRIIRVDDFNENRAKWFRYLAGTLDVRKVLKFEDRYGHRKGRRVYRVELVSSHLTSGPDGRYLIEIFADTEGSPKDPDPRIIQEGPFKHRDALIRFLKIGNLYLDLLYLNARKGDKQFEIAPDLTHIDFRYSTVVKDKTGTPITVSSWETHYGPDGRLLPPKQSHHYLKIWNNSPEPLRLDEGIHFKEGIHPRAFMGKLLRAMPRINYKPTTFIKDIAKTESGSKIPFIYSHK